MLAIRMQRIGRRGHAQFRVVVQDSRQSPKSGKFVALLGSYNPHTKATSLVKDKAQTYLDNGAQPSDRVALLFKSEGVKLPKWVSVPDKKAGKIKNQEKLRKNRTEKAEPAAKVVAAAEPEAETAAELEPATDTDQTTVDKPTEAIVTEELAANEPQLPTEPTNDAADTETPETKTSEPTKE